MSAKPGSSSSAVLTKLLPIGIIAIVIVVVLYFVFSGGSKAPAPTVAKPAAPAPAASAPAAAAATAAASDALPELTPQQLLKEASNAMREKRFVTPAGNNAFEYYERLLEKEPDNQTAKDALRETFPIVIGVPEQEINAGNIDEATRLINLLAKADPSNYTLTILRSKLDAKKKQVEREQAQATAAAAAAAAKAQAQAAAAAAAPAPATPAAPPPSAASSTAAAEPAGEAPAGNAARPAPKTVASATPPPAPAAPVGETHPAEILKSTPPDYPPDAVRRRQQGWVEVEFTVMPDGSVTNATVVNANPARIFNSAALSAVGRWTFKPRMENGKAVEERVRRRIEFKF